MKHNVSIIAAVSLDLGIGKDNDLLFHLPNDLKNFKELTTGKTVIMGRKTFDSLPKKPLPNRENIVITRDKTLEIEGVTVCHSLKDAIKVAINEEVFIIGGGQIYAEAMKEKVADTLYITKVDVETPDADTYFPAWDDNEWICESVTPYNKDEKHKYNYQIQVWHRK